MVVPYSLMDKGVVPTVEDVGLVMNMLAHFHGFWWRFLNCSTGIISINVLLQKWNYKATFRHG